MSAEVAKSQVRASSTRFQGGRRGLAQAESDWTDSPPPYIYVASSWSNPYQPAMVEMLRAGGFDVYDFKDEEGFNWREVDPHHERWNFDGWKTGLAHEAAERGFKRDMTALDNADRCVLVLPCGRSAHLEAGYCIGQGKPTAVWVPEFDRPDLMVKMADLVTDDPLDVLSWLGLEAQNASSHQQPTGQGRHAPAGGEALPIQGRNESTP